MTKCEICAEPNVGPEHEITEKHIKNRTLFEYSQNRKGFAGNRKGVVVSCNVKSSFDSILDSTDAKTKISAKPNEEIKFIFTIKNETKKEEIIVIFVQMMHHRLNFTMSNHGLAFGCKPLTLKAKTEIQQEVSVTFKSSDIGQYNMPMIFSFRKPATNEGILIMRDLIVFVEETQTVHEKVFSPYAQKEVVANKLFHTTIADRSDDMFRIPANFKPIYSNNLKIRKDASKDQRLLCEAVKEAFDTGVTPENYINFFHNLLWYEEAIVRINLKNYNMSGVPLLRQGDGYALVVPGLGEKRPSLMLGDILFVKPHDNDAVMFEAVIGDIQDNVTVLQGLDNRFHSYFSYQALFDIRFFMSRMPLERMHQAINCVVKGGPEQSRVFPVENAKIKPTKPIKNYYNHLVEENAEQRCVVEHILAGTAGTAPFLLHGPPGTGKTVTIVEAVLQLVNQSPKHRIMVCTDSNMAADHVATVIIKYAHMFSEPKLLLRANSQHRVWEALPEILRKYSNGHNRDTFERVDIETFMSYNIVVTTLSHAAKFTKELRRKQIKRPITHLFIDEAAQASEPSCMIPVCGLLAPRGALVLAGDPLQLGPVVISHGARALGLGLSLMERLKTTCPLYSDKRNDPNYMVMLRNNFRSNPDILDIPNDIFYKKQLRAQATEDPISKTDILGEKPTSRAVVFHGVLSQEQRMGKSPSYFNNMELELVLKYIRKLVTKHKVLPDDIGVVTPYIRQVYKIRTALSTMALGPGKIEVGTVEAFQGKEKRVIIISTVRANCGLLDHDAKFQLGFLVDDKRFNVALTRAKAKAIIIGNPLCLEYDVKWRTYIQKCRELGTYYGYDAQKYKSEEIQKDIVNRIAPMLKDMTINKTKA